MKINCIGDSLTYGNVGYSYLNFLDKRICTVNYGKNGDTLRGVYKRVKKVMRNPKKDSQLYILGIGTNDLFLPYLKSVSIYWNVQMSIRCKIKRCIEEDKVFYKEYEELLSLLYKRNKNVIIFGIPFINLKNFPHQRLIERNANMQDLANKYGYAFIDIYNLQKDKIRKDSKEYSWKYRFIVRVVDAIIMSLFPYSKDWFAKFRGLTTSVDGVHLNSVSAKILAAEIEKEISPSYKSIIF
ncbi:MAG: SGNH/GDSL hydrolase family protein [Tissierellia bacterium]|nr:SGNH/GDSL hydrolase family protein [Tissierellia bacterium]